MRGDFSRDTFDPRKRFSRVLMQQGRVQLDADWNEQTNILLHYLRTLATDIFGPHGGPRDCLGFEIITDNMAGAHDTIDRLVPDRERREVIRLALNNGDALIAPGRYYIAGVMVENHHPLLYSEQEGYGSTNQPTLNTILQTETALLAYLDVWEQQITAVEDDSIREVALGGPDTSTRARVAWQVKVLLAPPGTTVLDERALDHLLPIGTGRLRAPTRPADTTGSSTRGGYTGAENHLYRVEVHAGGTATSDSRGATFKWSRDNGSVTYPIRSMLDATVTLDHLGHDPRSNLSPGAWVEYVDDGIAMSETAGPLAHVVAVDDETLTVTLRMADGTTSLPAFVAARHPFLRRWDHAGNPAAGGALSIAEVNADETSTACWIALEDGIEISFAPGGGTYRSGDYWLIPARVITSDIEWPHETDSPHGPYHHFAPLLAVSRVPGTKRLANRDCRRAVAPVSMSR